MRPKLFINHLPEYDWLIALEFGLVDDGAPHENWQEIIDELGWMRDGPGGRFLGFKAVDFSEIDLDAPELAEIWRGPRFDVPLLGLTDVTAGEVMVGVRALLGDRPTTNRFYFRAAMAEEGEEALDFWLSCLAAGDSMAHFALGYTLYDLGRFHEAYRHLRHYTEISPSGAWPWCWYGKACEAIGETAEARIAYERAIEIEDDGGEETDAPELLEQLDEQQAA